MKEFDIFMDLTGKGRTLDCFYHGTHDPHLEGRIMEENNYGLVVGVSLWEQDILSVGYDTGSKSLNIEYQPPSPDDIRVDMLVMETFEVPLDIMEINIYDNGTRPDLSCGLPDDWDRKP